MTEQWMQPLLAGHLTQCSPVLVTRADASGQAATPPVTAQNVPPGYSVELYGRVVDEHGNTPQYNAEAEAINKRALHRAAHERVPEGWEELRLAVADGQRATTGQP